MSAAPAHFERSFTGTAATVGQARAFANLALTRTDVPEDVRGDAVQCVSELAANAVRHTESGQGGRYTVIVEAHGGRAHVEVVDQGAEHAPTVLLGDDEHGRGLWTCARLGVLTYAPALTGGRRVCVDLPHPTGGAAVDPNRLALTLACPGDGSDQR